MSPDIQIIYERYSRHANIIKNVSTSLSFLSVNPTSIETEKTKASKYPFHCLQRALFLSKVFAMIMYSIFIIIRYGHSTFHEGLPLMQRMHHSVLFVYYTFIPLLEYVHWSLQASWLQHFNRVKTFLCQAQGNVPSKDQTSSVASIRNHQTIWILFLIAANFNSFLLSLHAVVFEDSPESLVTLIRSLLPETRAAFYVVPPLAFLSHLYILSNVVSMGAVIYFTFVTTLPPINILLETMRKLGGESGYREKHMQIHIKTYKEATLLFQILGESYGAAIGLVQVNVTLCTVIAVYCVVRIGGHVGLTSGTLGIATFSLFLSMLRIISHTHAQSLQLRQTWRTSSHKLSKATRRSLTSLRPLTFSIGGLYYLDNMILFTMFQITLDSSINVLIGTRV